VLTNGIDLASFIAQVIIMKPAEGCMALKKYMSQAVSFC